MKHRNPLLYRLRNLLCRPRPMVNRNCRPWYDSMGSHWIWVRRFIRPWPTRKMYTRSGRMKPSPWQRRNFRNCQSRLRLVRRWCLIDQRIWTTRIIIRCRKTHVSRICFTTVSGKIKNLAGPKANSDRPTRKPRQLFRRVFLCLRVGRVAGAETTAKIGARHLREVARARHRFWLCCSIGPVPTRTTPQSFRRSGRVCHGLRFRR